jgi:hypothetical protein
MQPLKPQNQQSVSSWHSTVAPSRWAATRIAHAWRLSLSLALPIALLTLPNAAHAFCGFYAGKADANLFNEACQVVVVVRDGKRTVISMLNDYKGPLSEFALIVPTPTVLQQGQVRVAERTTFERLDAYSSPRLAEYHDADPCQVHFNWGQEYLYKRRHMMNEVASAAAMAPRAAKDASRDKALGVTVEAQYTLEEYDIVSLSATQSDGLETWLGENGYKIPKGASAALRPYINQGMKFFVAKVNLKEQLKTGYTTLRPLQFAFESDKFMLPMRLGLLNAPPDKAQDLIIYLLTKNGRVESSNYRTVKLPSNVNLPHFIKPKFQDFYKAMFDDQARKEDHRVVFTEYFWDMAWCDPCAANPLTPDELRSAGVSWATTPGQAQPVVLTRLHVRYTANTFPEDLMFIQTKDRQNWQTRYVVQTPYAGSVAQCSDKVGQMDCEAMCKPRVAQQLGAPDYEGAPSLFRSKDALSLQRDCVSACVAAKQAGIATATRYYQTELPQRLATEKQTLAQLTGWSLAKIDAMPGAAPSRAPTPAKPWWEELFAPKKVKP